jgi:hypothetical protein
MDLIIAYNCQSKHFPSIGLILTKCKDKHSLTVCSATCDHLRSEFLATDPEVRVRFPALPDFLRSSGSGTGSTQPREYN